jgi:small subunit ribosomal protein S2
VADEKPADDQFTASDEPLPEWERDLLGGAAPAAAPADAPAEESQQTTVSDEAVADAEIAADSPDVDAIAAAAAAEDTPEAAEAAAEDAAE